LHATGEKCVVISARGAAQTGACLLGGNRRLLAAWRKTTGYGRIKIMATDNTPLLNWADPHPVSSPSGTNLEEATR
jgi:hypothetical protein